MRYTHALVALAGFIALTSTAPVDSSNPGNLDKRSKWLADKDEASDENLDKRWTDSKWLADEEEASDEHADKRWTDSKWVADGDEASDEKLDKRDIHINWRSELDEASEEDK